MVKQSRDEKTLSIFSRQFGHLPDPGWRPARPTPIEAWDGLILEDDPTPCSRMASELLYMCGSLFSCGPLKPICDTAAKARRMSYSAVKCVLVCFCGCLIPSRLKHHQRKVVAIVIPQQGLTGSLPKQPGWGLLKLNRLILYGNAIHGPLRGIAKFTFLEVLNLSSNRLTGKLPGSLYYLRGLRILDLHGNAFTGNLDDQVSRIKLHQLRRLTYISFDDNLFEGPFPTSFTKMPWLIELHLSGMTLVGPLPNCEKLSKLKVIDLSFNAFTGLVPDFGRMPESNKKKIKTTPKLPMESFDSFGSDRSKRGNKQKQRKARRNIQELNNREDILNIQRVVAEDDKLNTVNLKSQTSIQRFQSQEASIVTKESNSIIEPSSESIVDDEHVYCETTETVTGVVPCLSLRVLQLTRNQLSGPIPVSYGRLTNLERLEIGSNKLSNIGYNQISWSCLTKLEHVDFSRNQIEGPIPLQ